MSWLGEMMISNVRVRCDKIGIIITWIVISGIVIDLALTKVKGINSKAEFVFTNPLIKARGTRKITIIKCFLFVFKISA